MRDSLKMLHATKGGKFKVVRDKGAPKNALCNEIELRDLHFAIFRDLFPRDLAENATCNESQDI